jgi:fatty acid desaturase
VISGLWLVPILTTFGVFYGGWLRFLCNNTQHAGLQDDVPDFRLCTRTVLLGPLTRFLYWHMNYHIEHHMYAAVPCYNLGRLHRAIRHDLPKSPQGLWAAWRQIVTVLKRQAAEPEYQFMATLPPTPTLQTQD